MVDQLLQNKARGNQFRRHVYADLQQALQLFLEVDGSSKWIIVSGLRGVGKTTLLAQLYNDPLLANQPNKFYLSLEIVHKLQATTFDIEEVLTKRLQHRLATYNQPLFLFLDEVHFLPNWALFVKTLIDTAGRLFVVCTGSSALSLQTNADIARRADFIKINPLAFTEFEALRRLSVGQAALTFPYKEVSQQLEEALFTSNDISEVGSRLQALIPQVETYESASRQASILQFDSYLTFGTLPYALELNQAPSRFYLYPRIMQTLDNVLLKDIALLHKFESQVLNAFPRLLFLLVHAESRSLPKLADQLGLSVVTIKQMLDTLLRTDIITAAKPLGYSQGHARKPDKYLFTAASMRSALAYEMGAGVQGSFDARSQFRGHLFEDIIVNSLRRIFIDRPLGGSLEYDAAQAGADFIVSRTGLKADAVVIEVGLQKSDKRQVIKTLKRTGKYGLIFTSEADFGLAGSNSKHPVARFKIDTDNRIAYVAWPVLALL